MGRKGKLKTTKINKKKKGNNSKKIDYYFYHLIENILFCRESSRVVDS